MKKIISLVLGLFLCCDGFSKTLATKIIPSGRFAPMYGIETGQNDFLIRSFRVDKYPVTNKDFLEFTLKNPEWDSPEISPIYGDNNYLSIKNWKSSKIGKYPVVFISWFAANAYCELKKGRLPTTLEWEYIAAASENRRDASHSQEFIDKILIWYAKPQDATDEVNIGKGRANFYGIYDLHGLIWEWTSDFNSVIMTSDNRSDGDKEKVLFCGGSSIGAKSKEDYAAFMRYSLRSSLRADYTLRNLGFRCAYDL